MQFLLEIRVDLPADMPQPRRTELRERELARGRELMRAGVIKHIWRVPGGLRNVAVWEAADATELHDAIASLPMYPWITCHVTPLAVHPLQLGEETENG